MTANLVIATLLVAASALSPGVSSFNYESAPQAQPQTQKPVRVFVQTDDTGVAEELAARQTSVKDLSDALASHKKLFVVVDDEDKSEIQIEVLGRGLTVPKVVLGLGPRPGESSIGSAPTKTAELRIRVTVTSSDLAAELKNKNKANDNPRGWKSAADDLANQLDKWVLENRAAIGRDSSIY
jgi:hypothetical protein